MAEISPEGLFSSSLDIARPIVETACELVKDILGQPCKVAGGMLSDQIYAWQWGNRLRILAKAKKRMDENGDAAKVLPPGFFLPFLEAAGNAEGEDIEELWANLLANSLSIPEARHPMVLNVLKQLSAEDASWLDRECKRVVGIGRKAEWWFTADDIESGHIARLVALGLLWKPPMMGDIGNPNGPALIALTGFALRFHFVVQPPKSDRNTQAT